MHNIVTDSLIYPHNLLNYRQKRGFFVFVYLLILALFVSLDGIIHYAGYAGNSTITSETTGCAFSGGSLSCDGEAYDPDQQFAYFGYSLYFVEGSATLTDPEANRIVVQDHFLAIVVDGTELYRLDLSFAISDLAFDEFFATLTNAIRWSGGFFLWISNLVILLAIALLTSISFIRLSRFVRYRIIFKLLVFALTPFALLMTLYNLLDFNTILFYVLMFVSYRSIFILQQVLTRETFLHLNELAGGKAAGPVGPAGAPDPEKAEPEEPKSEEEETEAEDEDSPTDGEGE